MDYPIRDFKMTMYFSTITYKKVCNYNSFVIRFNYNTCKTRKAICNILRREFVSFLKSPCFSHCKSQFERQYQSVKKKW